jgi:hypothetical protein
MPKINFGRDYEIMQRAVNDLGQEQAVAHMLDAVESGKVKPEEYSLVDLYEALDTTQFPKATAALIHKKVMDGYQSTPTIGDMLVTTVPSSKKVETIVGFTAAEGPKQVLEGMPYEDSGISEKYVTIENRKFGRLISVTEETLQFDQTGQILQRAYRIGEKAAYYREKEIVEAVAGINAGYWPSGVSTTFYGSHTQGANTVSGAGGVINETTLQLVKDKMDLMTDENGDYILVNPTGMIMLVPPELEVEAWQCMTATAFGVRGTDHFPVPNFFAGRYKVLSSPFLTTATTFYLGDFKKDWWWTEVYPIQIQIKKSDEDKFHRDVLAYYKVRYFGRCGAVGFEHSYSVTN